MEVENFLPGTFAGRMNRRHRGSAFEPSPESVNFNDELPERGFDLNELLIRKTTTTFLMKVNGNSMINAGIFDDDIVLVDERVKPANGAVVIADVDGDLLLRRYEKTINKLKLVAESSKASTLEVGEFNSCKIRGVVIAVIRNL